MVLVVMSPVSCSCELAGFCEDLVFCLIVVRYSKNRGGRDSSPHKHCKRHNGVCCGGVRLHEFHIRPSYSLFSFTRVDGARDWVEGSIVGCSV